MEFRDAVKYLRSELGLTQVELAMGLHMNAITIGRWEKGKTVPARSITTVLLEYARAKGASSECLDVLSRSIHDAARNKLDFSGDERYAVEQASLRQIIDDASFAVYVCDLETYEILYINRKTTAMVGENISAVGMKCYECLMHRDAPCVFCHKDELTEDAYKSYDVRRLSDGEIYRVQSKLIQWNGRRAQIHYLSGEGISSEQQPSETDITAARLETLFADVNGGVSAIVYEDNGTVRFAYANDRYYELFGYTKEQFAAEQESTHNAIYPDDRDKASAAIAKVKETKQAVTFRYRIIKRDKSIAYVRCNSSLTSMVGVSGHVLISILTDITESVELERQAIVSGHRLDAIMKNMNCAVTAAIVKSGDTVEMLFSNDLFQQILGYTKEQYQAEVSDLLTLIHPDDLGAVRDAALSLRHIGDAKELQYRIFTRDGHIKWIRERISLMIFPDADEPVQLGIYSDVTEAVEAQQQIAAQRDQIAEMLNDTPSGLAISEVDPNDIPGTLRTVYYNDRYISFSGYSRDEYDAMLEKKEMKFVFAEDAPALLASTLEICRGEIGTSAETTIRCHTKDGGFRWLLLRGQLAERRGNICVINNAMMDITERQEAIERQRISEEMLRIAAETDQRAMVIYDVKNNTCRVESRTLFSAKYGETFVNIPQSLIDMGLTAPECEDELCALFARIREGEKQIRVSLQLHSGPDKYDWFECNATTVFDNGGYPDHAVLGFRNVTEQRVKEAVFRKWQQSIDARPPESYSLFRCNLSRDASFDKQDGSLLKISFPADAVTFNSRTKYHAEEFVYPDDREEYMRLLDADLLIAMFHRGEHYATMDYREMTGNGEIRWCRLTVETVEYPDSTDVQAFLMYEDIDEDKKAEIEAIELAKSDPLTGALNRSAFAERVGGMIRKEPNMTGALIMLDMDGFKQLNDTFGHAAGDQALQEVVAVLRAYSRNGDLICRLGGDEFMVWLRDVPYDAVIGKTAQQMCEHIRKAYSQEVLLSASAGIAVYPRDGHSYDELYPNADKALYKVKQAAKGSYAFFSAAGEELTGEIAQALSDVRQVPGAPRIKRRRMLIVDDSETNREMLKGIFKEEYLIEIAKNGAEAMVRLRHFGSSISVVLLDLIMPDIDGFTVLRRMQSDIDLRTIPVVIVTGDEMRSTLLKALELGAAEYVSKPVDVDIIRMRVHSVVSKAENERLRAQNSYLMLQRDEEVKYHTVLESTGTVVVEYDWRNHVFIYDGEISKYIAGNYDHRGLWQVFLSDMVADSSDVKELQDTLIGLANGRDRNRDSKLVRLKTAEGDRHWFRANFYKSVDDFGLAEKVIITFNDVDEEVLANEKLLFQATRDELTGLYNRVAFLEKAAELIAGKEPGYYMMACLDIEKFQIINDRYGTEKGDKVLKHIALALGGFLQSHSGICCRYTADKFAALYPAKLLDTGELAEKRRVAAAPDCLPRPLRLRIGRCLVNDTTLPPSAMFDRAAMAEALVKGRYDTSIIDYDDSMRDDILREQQIVGDMVDALSNGEFEPWFQPQFNHSTGAMIGAEALVRWRKDGRIIAPNDFIPIFEKNGFIYEVDQHIWRSVCILLRRWLDEGKKPLPVSVNISRSDMFQENFIDVVTGLIAEYQLPVDLLRLEITESAFSADTDTIKEIAGKLIAAGFTVEIDDFGSGYSSLNTLKDVPASILKLDMRFFERTGDAKRGGNIVESVVRMAKWLGMAVIAEGVEDKAQADYLKSIGCFYIQGYLYAKPMPAAEYEKQLDSRSKEAQLTRLQTLQNMDNNEFWDSHSMDTLIFNSYVGAACILELSRGKVEMLRATEHFARMLSGSTMDIQDVLAIDWVAHMDSRNICFFTDAVLESSETKETVIREFEFHDLPGCPKTVILRSALRVIATVGERILIYCLNDNMTAQRTAELEAFHASERVNAVMDNSHCGISAVIANPDGTVELLFVNNRFFELLGYTREQYAAEVKSPYDRVLPEDREKVLETVTKITEIGSTATLEVRELRRDGSVVWLRSDISIVKFANTPGPVQITSFLDITEQKENELKQLESARQLQVIMSNVNGGVSALKVFDDATSKFVFNNDRYYELYGYTKEEALAEGLDVIGRILPDDLPGVMEKIRQMKADRQPQIIDYRITKKDGRYAMLRANASLMSIQGYGDDVITSVVTDITEKKSLEETLGAIVANINGGISAVYLKKDRPEYVIANEQYFRLLGYTREEFEAEGINPFDLIHPDDREWVERRFAESQKYGEQYSMEYRIILRDGSVRYILCNTNVVRLFGIDEPVQLAVSNDITEIREMQRKELALSTQLQTIMKNIRGGITATLYHDEGNIEIVFSNDGFYEMYGYTKAQMEAEVPNMLDLIYAEDRERTMETVARIVRERGSETYEYRCHKRGGGTVWIQCTNSVFSLAGVGDTVLLAVTTDVTELRLAQQEQLAATDRLSTVMNAMSNGMTAVVFHDNGMQFLFANNRYYEMYGIHRGDIGEKHLSDVLNLVVPKYRDTLRNAVRGAAKTGQPVTVEYQIRRPDGVIRWMHATIGMTRLAGVDDPVQVSVFSDVTVEKESTDQLRFLNDTAREILAQSDSDQAIRDTLTSLVTYFSADRGYVIELDEDHMVLSNTYEACADGIAPLMENWQALPYTVSDYWYASLSHNKFFTVEDVSAMDDSQSELREMLLSQGIRSLILAPLWRDGRLIAFAGVDNPAHTFHHLEQLKALTDYSTVLLTRRDLMRKIKHDSEMVQQLMDDTPGGFLRVAIDADEHPRIENFNDGFCRMLRMTREEVMAAYGRDALLCFAPEDIERTAADAAEAQAACGEYSGKCRLRQKNGQFLWTMVYGRFVRDENGRQFLNSYFTDITEKLAAEENQKTLLDNLPFGAAMYEYDGTHIAAIHLNRQYWKLVGREPAEYDKTVVTDAIHPDDRAVTVQEVQAAVRQERSIALDIRILNGNGSYSPFHVTATVVPKSDGRYQLFAAYSPISDEAISLQEMLPIAMSTMMETSEDISYIKGKDLHYIACSQALADMTGYAGARDLIGKNAYDVFDWTFAEKFTEDDRNIIETGKPVIDAIEHIPAADGGISVARTSKYPIRDASGDVIGIYCISHDVTAQRQRDSQLDLLSRSIPGGLAAYSISGTGVKTLYFNDGYYAFSGYTREEYTKLTEKDPLALVLEEDRDELRGLLRTFMTQRQDGMTGSCDYRCRTKDGQICYMSLKAVLTQLDADQFMLNAVQFDMTQHVEMEQRMENLLDNLPFGAAMYEFDGEHLKTLHINQQYQIMVGRTRNSATLGNYSPTDFIHPDDRGVALNAIKDAIANHRDASCNIRVLYGENEYRSFHLDARITAQPGGRYLVYVAYTRLSEREMTFENALPHMFAATMESSTDIAFAKDINYRYICCSKTFAALLGLASEGEVVGKTDYELFPQEVADMFRRDDSALFATQKPQIDIQEMLPSPDGAKHYIRTSKHLLRSDTDAVIGIYCIGRDITEVREAYAELRLLTDSIPGGIATFRCSSDSLETVYFNDGVCELAGYSREEYEANPVPLQDLIFAEDRPVILQQIELLQSGETSLNFTVRIHTKDGGYKWINDVATVTDKADGVYSLSAVLTDVTGQQEERERLRLAEEEYRIATSHSGHTIGRYDIASQTLTISEDASVNLSLPESIPDVPYGRVKLGKISMATAKEYINFYEKIMHGEKECSVTFQKLLSIGWRWINERATTIFDESGKPVSAIISYSDVTDQQEKEAVYKKWQQNLMQKGPKSYTLYRCNLNRDSSYDTVEGELLNIHEGWDEAETKTFNERTYDFVEHCVVKEDRDMYLRFVNSDTMLASYHRGRRSANIEFRGLVATGEIRWMRLSVELVEYPNTTDVAAYLMYEDINDSKLMALKTQTMAETDPLTGILNRKTFIARMDEMLATRRGNALYALLLLDMDGFKLINDSFGHAVGDQMLIDTARAMQSVLRDSDLVCRMGGDEFLICLSAVPDRDTVLKLTRRIIDLMHGIAKLEVKLSVSAGIAVCPEDGTTFELLYPKVDKALYHVKSHGKDNCAFYDASMKTALISTVEHVFASDDPAEKPTMLIVDSNSGSRKLMTNVFAADFKVETAEDGASALKALRYSAKDAAIVLLEMNLSDMDGFTVLERMQEQESSGMIPVVAVSEMDERDAALRVIKAGASDFVTKPIDPTLLRIRAESAIAKAENERLRARNRFLSILKSQEKQE